MKIAALNSAPNCSDQEDAARLWLMQNAVYRGQWCGSGGLRSALPTMAFGTIEAARIYAEHPNDDRFAEGREIHAELFEARLIPRKIYARCGIDDHDPFFDLDVIAAEFGREVLRAIVSEHGAAVTETNGYEDLHVQTGLDLEEMIEAWPSGIAHLPPVPGHLALRVPEFVAALQVAGYDAVMLGGCGDNALELEWHIFDPELAVDAISGEPLPVTRADWDDVLEPA